MFHASLAPGKSTDAVSSGLPALLDLLARCSSRPRYAFMLLGLIAQVADRRGAAGPFVRRSGQTLLLRDWLSDALAPMGGRDPRRAALIDRVRSQLAREGRLPAVGTDADAVVEAEVSERVRISGKTNLSRAVSELTRAGLLHRHYQGYRIDHLNRGGQRHAVYTLAGPALCLLSRIRETDAGPARQMEFALG